ncbi:hypothetical protein HORIV_64050 [Vreelandella olivaria]|uniref:Solute-binding protein family 5 domain-containing protein n=1 Tax=Vreelandella olivaria TaxID=390919 RepID=A0ABM7GT26_9GAMM|nr:hypothetical protein HORIV_64050 [Halomonas olivaria]
MINEVSGNSAERLKTSDGYQVKATNAGNYTDLVMRFDQQPTSRPEFREAMKYLFDREQIKRVALRGYGEIANDQPIISSSPYYFDGLPQREYDQSGRPPCLPRQGWQAPPCHWWRRLRLPRRKIWPCFSSSPRLRQGSTLISTGFPRTATGRTTG